MKRCPYCGAEHGRRGKYCSDEHADRTARQLAAASAGRRRNTARVLAVVHRRVVRNGQWRDVAMGRDEAANLAAIFDPKRKPRRGGTRSGHDTEGATSDA